MKYKDFSKKIIMHIRLKSYIIMYYENILMLITKGRRFHIDYRVFP